MVYWIFGTNTSCPSKAMQNGILSLIQAINKPNCWQEALILYLVSENELSKPNQFRCLEIHRFLPENWSKTGLWLAQKTLDFAKQRWFYSLKSSNQHRTQMMMFWRRHNDPFTRCFNFSFDLYSVSRHISKHYSKHAKSPYFVRSIFFYIFTRQIYLIKRFVNILTLSDLVIAWIVVVYTHQQRSMTIHT